MLHLKRTELKREYLDGYDFTLKERKRNTKIRELLGLEPVSLVIKEGRLRWW